MKFREYILKSGTKIFLGKNAKNNDELVESFKGKENIILHTISPGSPFCVIEKLKPKKDEIKESAIITASKSQDWRNNQTDVKVHQFTGKDVVKSYSAKQGSWEIKSKPKIINIKKLEIKKWLEKNDS